MTGPDRRAEDHVGHIEGKAANVNRRHGETGVFSASAGHVQIVDAGEPRAAGVGARPYEPPAELPDVVVGIKDRVVDERICKFAETILIVDAQLAVRECCNACQRRFQFLQILIQIN